MGDPAPFTPTELTLLQEALDSHIYWQISDPADRRNGTVSEAADSNPEIKEARELIEKIEGLLGAGVTPA